MDALFGKSRRKPGGVLVLYTTRHGATQRYAERIAAPLDSLVKDAAYAKIADAKTYDAIVVGCCVYAGKLKGLDFLERHAVELASRLRGLQCHVNLIPLNAVEERHLKGVSEPTVTRFLSTLERLHISATRRREMGDDIEGACGQLRRKTIMAQ